MEKWRKKFSHNMRLCDREAVAKWIRVVRRHNLPEHDSDLHWAGINIFTAIGKVAEGPYRRELFARLDVIDRQRAKNQSKSS